MCFICNGTYPSLVAFLRRRIKVPLLATFPVQSHVDEVVYSFGHMLYEMNLGCQLRTATVDSCPPGTPESVADILRSILTPQGIKNGLPSIADLLSNPFFAEVNGLMGEKPSLRVPSKLKEVLKAYTGQVEQRLHEYQKRVSQFRRLSKAHENLKSEEEKKKRRKKMKKQMSLQETTEPQSYPTTTSLPRQQTISHISAHPPKTNSTASSSASATKKTSSSKSTTPAPKAPPPPAAAAPPSPRPTPAPSRSGERGALLGSIESFSKGKLKKAVTNDRSAPLVRR